jgi:hypothetical protein
MVFSATQCITQQGKQFYSLRSLSGDSIMELGIVASSFTRSENVQFLYEGHVKEKKCTVVTLAFSMT